MTQGSRPEVARELYRELPSVDEALRDPRVRALEPRLRRELLAAFVASVIDGWRGEIRSGALTPAELRGRLESGALAAEVEALVRREEGRGLRRVLNATGVVLHTGLGRAPLHERAAAAMARAAAGYCVLEVDRYSGERNQRDQRLSELLVRLTGAEAAIVVNNNAAAVFLCLAQFAAGREAVVSRGELVEIGGSFRVPDVMTRAGVHLVEVGTTNRTRAADYEQAIGAETGLLMKVHRSNFRQLGFVEELDVAGLARLGATHAIPTCFDLGSGLIELEQMRRLDFLEGETQVRAAVQSGVDVVTFSGDKLLGGPQAGLIVGKRAAVSALRSNPIYRALRIDKVTIAGLEATLELYLEGLADELPTRLLLGRSAEELERAARELARELGALPGLAVRVAADRSEPGSGSAPGVYLDTWVVRLRPARGGAQSLAASLRAGEPPLFTRIQDDEVLLDPRTLLPGESALCIQAIRHALSAE